MRSETGSHPLRWQSCTSDQLGLASATLVHGHELESPELVLIVNEPWSPQRFALHCRGFRYVVCRDELAEWLPSVLTQLCSIAHARRFALSAYANIPVPPALLTPHRDIAKMRLYAAETSFRGTYFRALLAEHGSRRKAAQAAGVPYRSFCEMLRKLGI